MLGKITIASNTVRTDLMEQLRRPEYTGENRCIPCTAVNLVIAAVLAGGTGYGLAWSGVGTSVSALSGTAVFAVCVAAIYLRGYLVPYTPTLTKRYFPDRVLRWFDKRPTRSGSVDGEFEPVDVERTLIEMDVLTDCDHRNDLCLARSFQQDWRAEIAALRDGEALEKGISELLEIDDPGRLDVREFGNAAVVNVDGRQVGQWESDTAFIADIAADRALRKHRDRWTEIDVLNRSRILNSLRVFLERCPSCDAPVTVGQETVESCCRSMDVFAVTCEECGSRIFEIELTEELKQQL